MTAWAHVQSGMIMPNTVADTPRGAMVNALVSVYELPVYSKDNENKIIELYEQCKGEDDHIIRVEIKEAKT